MSILIPPLLYSQKTGFSNISFMEYIYTHIYEVPDFYFFLCRNKNSEVVLYTRKTV